MKKIIFLIIILILFAIYKFFFQKKQLSDFLINKNLSLVAVMSPRDLDKKGKLERMKLYYDSLAVSKEDISRVLFINSNNLKDAKRAMKIFGNDVDVNLIENLYERIEIESKCFVATFFLSEKKDYRDF